MKSNLMHVIQARIRRAGSLHKLAHETGLARSYLSRLARGLKSNPSLETLQKLGIEQHIVYILKG